MKSVLMLVASAAFLYAGGNTDAYLNALKEQGREPIGFTLNKLDTFDLVIFDDALHNAAEPFDFYQELISRSEFVEKAGYIFVEIFSTDHQRYIDAYLNTAPEDTMLLLPVFQNDYSGTGWNARTYLDLLRTVYRVNRSLPETQRLKVIAVSNPFYWEAIKTPQDLEIARRSLTGRDYFMYLMILRQLNNFEDARKGIFLTNTRHAYKGIRNRAGRFYWNTGTFFHQWHPGKTCSIRMHNLSLYITAEVPDDSITHKTTAGMERMRYSWVRVDSGNWDRAFRAYGNKPVAVPLAGTPFGQAPYIGNHMLDAAAGQTMFDAYDAVIFLAPIEELHQTATFDFIYTAAFRSELERRYRILYTPQQIRDKLAGQGVAGLQQLFEKQFAAQPKKIHALSGSLAPL